MFNIFSRSHVARHLMAVTLRRGNDTIPSTASRTGTRRYTPEYPPHGTTPTHYRLFRCSPHPAKLIITYRSNSLSMPAIRALPMSDACESHKPDG